MASGSSRTGRKGEHLGVALTLTDLLHVAPTVCFHVEHVST